MKKSVIILSLGLLTFSSAMAEVTLTINNKDFPAGSSCHGTGVTVVKLTEGQKYDLKLGSDCEVIVKKIQ